MSTWRRVNDDTMPPRIKTGANYHNSRLAQHEAVRNGYDTAIFLNHKATVAECPGSCIAIYRNGVLIVTVPNIPGFYTDNIGARGKGTFIYRVCGAGTQNCSNQVTVKFGGG